MDATMALGQVTMAAQALAGELARLKGLIGDAERSAAQMDLMLKAASRDRSQFNPKEVQLNMTVVTKVPKQASLLNSFILRLEAAQRTYEASLGQRR